MDVLFNVSPTSVPKAGLVAALVTVKSILDKVLELAALSPFPNVKVFTFHVAGVLPNWLMDTVFPVKPTSLAVIVLLVTFTLPFAPSSAKVISLSSLSKVIPDIVTLFPCRLILPPL